MKDQLRGSSRSRRRHERKFKDELIAQSLVPGVSVAGIAMKSGINTNLLFKWRREHVRKAGQHCSDAATLLPVCVIPDAGAVFDGRPMARALKIAPVAIPQNPNVSPVAIEIEIAGAQLRLSGNVEETTLISILRALRRSA